MIKVYYVYSFFILFIFYYLPGFIHHDYELLLFYIFDCGFISRLKFYIPFRFMTSRLGFTTSQLDPAKYFFKLMSLSSKSRLSKYVNQWLRFAS